MKRLNNKGQAMQALGGLAIGIATLAIGNCKLINYN